MKALILCHNRNLGKDLSGHWSGELFIKIQEKYFPNIIFTYDTVDLAALRTLRESPDLGDQKHFQVDAWSSDFTSNHKHEYNIVFMPDCGGRWFTEVFNTSSEKSLQKIIEETMELVAFDGILYVSKLTEHLSDFIRENLIFLEHNKFMNEDYYVFLRSSYKMSALNKFRVRIKHMKISDLSGSFRAFDDPRLKLAKYVYVSGKEAMTQEQYELVYFSLFSLVGVRGIAYVNEHYNDVITVLEENWAAFDQTLQTPATEGGFFANDRAQCIKEIEPVHTTIVFGGGLNRYRYSPSTYLVNIYSTEDHIKDVQTHKPNNNRLLAQLRRGTHVHMVADMNNAEQLKNIPDKRFNRIYVEHVPPQDYWNPHFFNNAKRILKDDGSLYIDMYTTDEMKKEPYSIKNSGKFFEQNGFQLERTGECEYPIIEGRTTDQCLILRKLLPKDGAALNMVDNEAHNESLAITATKEPTQMPFTRVDIEFQTLEPPNKSLGKHSSDPGDKPSSARQKNQSRTLLSTSPAVVKVRASSRITKKKVLGLGALALAASAGMHQFLLKVNVTQARAGVAFQRERLDQRACLGRRDALALMRATGGKVQARTLLGTRAEIMDYLLALRGFQTNPSNIGTAPECPDVDVIAKIRRLVRRSSAMTREEWVALFPCILEIAITDPDRQGRRRRTDVTCEMITREPWLALGRLPRETTK